jgi:hypothetical protein
MTLVCSVSRDVLTQVKPLLVAPLLAIALAEMERIPYVLDHGRWTGRDQPLPTAAQKLLRPNAVVSRTYEDNQKGELGAAAGRERSATLLIVQCRDSRDMLGHYPPRCYRSHGMEQKYAEPRDWKVGGMTIPGVEYGFEQKLVGQTYRTTVYNFFVVPGGKSNNPLRRDMDAVRDAAEDYQQRYYGAAQFQVVFQGLSSADLSRSERDEIFRTLIEPTIPVIRTLSSGGLP